MRYRNRILITVLCLLILIVWAQAAEAQIIWSGRGSSRAWDINPHDLCVLPPEVRYLQLNGITMASSNADYLVVGINMATTDPDLIALPYDLVIVGHPSGQNPPPGIPPYVPGSPCWNLGVPTFGPQAALSAAVTTDPLNPIAGIGTWMAFLIPLSPQSLPLSAVTNLEAYFTLDHNGNALEVMNDVKGFVSGIIRTSPPDTVLRFQSPAFGPQVFTKMHFPQYPDSFGMDINFTDPKVLADDWLCTQPDPVKDIRFWFSAQGDWFDLGGDLNAQIHNIHVSIHSNIPDPDGQGPEYSQPGVLLWERDFSVDEVVFSYFGESPQDWYDPNTGEVFVGDHANIYECRISDIVDPFAQEMDSIYWLDLSIATDDPEAHLLGWKTSDRAVYPAGYADHHFMDDAVWGDLPAPLWVNLTYPQGPYIGQSLDFSFVLDEEVISVAVCHDSIWHDEEFCGFDANYVTGFPEMNHTCFIDFLDMILFAQDYLQTGSALSGDFNGDGLVDLFDFAVFAGGFGQTVVPCNPYPLSSPVFEGTIALSFSTDPFNIVSTMNVGPGLHSAYVVIDGWTNAVGVEYMVETSPNIQIVASTVPTLPVSTVSLSNDPDMQHSHRAFTVAGTTWPPGPVLFGQIDFILWDTAPATLEFSRVAFAPGNPRNRWTTAGANRSHIFTHRYGAGINGPAPSGIEEGTPKPFRIVSVSPNPFNPTTTVHFTLPSIMPVTAEIWSVTGERIRVIADKQRFGPGDNKLEWDGRNDEGALVASGVYFVRLETPLGVKVSRAVALK